MLLGGIVLLGVGCPPQQPTPSALRTSSMMEVMMTASGFTPASITVPVGATVVFRNADTTPHWVASEPHPIHTGLPGFDAGRDIPAGGTYSFTFTKIGTFTYHDHLKPNVKGTVVVQ